MLCQEHNAATMKFTDRKVSEWECMNTVELKEQQVLRSFRKHDLRTFLFLCNVAPSFFKHSQSKNKKTCVIHETEENPHLVTANINMHTQCTH